MLCSKSLLDMTNTCLLNFLNLRTIERLINSTRKNTDSSAQTTSATINAKKEPSPLMAFVRKPTEKRTSTAKMIQ